MKKRTKLLLLAALAAVLMLSAGCTKGQKEEGGYKVYYVNDAGTRLMEEAYTPGAQTFEEMMEELLGQLSKPPSGYRSALPDKVKINGFERGIDALRIDFSGEYYDLSNTEEVLLRAAVVKTVSQIPGVTKIMITVDQQQLVDAQGKPVPAMDANTFIDTKEGGINSYQYTKLMLYFADKEELVRCCVFRMCAALLYDAYLQSARAGNRPVADRVLAMVEYIIDYYTENVGILKLIYHDLSRGVLKDDIMEFMSPDFAGMFQELFSYDTEKEYRRTIHQVFISIELTSSLSYLAIVEKKPDTIEVMKPYILDSVRKILGKG